MIFGIKRWMVKAKKGRIVIILLMLSFLTCQFVFADTNLAPLNPDYVRYIEDLALGKVEKRTREGYGLGYIPSPVDFSHLKGKSVVSPERLLIGFPKKYDLRDEGRLTPIRNQGGYGTCWAFATYGSLESCLLPRESWDFSENNMANLHGFDPKFHEGGNSLMSSAYLLRWSGPVEEKDDPYANPGGSPSGLPVRKHIQGVQIIPERAGPTDNNNIKQAVMDHGAFYTSMCWSNSYYNGTTFAYYYDKEEWEPGGGHAVAIVGWDDDFERSKFLTHPPGDGAFIARNSWGTGWGDNGYFYISYYDTQVGKNNFLFCNAEPLTNYDQIYQYDPLGWTSEYGFEDETGWFANIFTPILDAQLKAVGFYASRVDSSYEIFIYNGVSLTAPRSGSLVGTKSGTIQKPGYHTIPIDSPIYISRGRRFSVVVKLTTPGREYPIVIERPVLTPIPYSSGAKANPRESFVSQDGETWADITTVYSNTNVCLKAYASSLKIGRVDDDDVVKKIHSYPNPFVAKEHNYITIRVELRSELPKDSVTMEIYDIAGELVRKVDSNDIIQNEGVYTYQWNGKNDGGRPVGNGVYLYRVKMSAGKRSKEVFGKLIVVR